MSKKSNDLKKFLDLTWNGLNEVLLTFTEEELKKLIALEKKNKNRAYILKRLAQRYTTLRRNNELKAIVG